MTAITPFPQNMVVVELSNLLVHYYNITTYYLLLLLGVF